MKKVFIDEAVSTTRGVHFATITSKLMNVPAAAREKHEAISIKKGAHFTIKFKINKRIWL